MNYFKEAEEVLYNRKKLGQALENLNHRRNRLMHSGAPHEIGGMDFESPNVGGGIVNNTMQDCLDLIETNREITRTEEKIREVDDVLHQLPDEDCKLLMMWYVDGLPKEQIGAELHYSSRHTVYDHKNHAVAQFAVLYFGAPALNSV